MACWQQISLYLNLHKMGIDKKAVLKAAGTKWNFLKFQPGLVGGRCIGVDPYYLTYKAEQMGYHDIILPKNALFLVTGGAGFIGSKPL